MEGNPVPIHSLRQDELIRRYCEEADSLLRAAPDLPTALRLKDELCDRFQRECDSELIVTATMHYIDDLLLHQWGRTRQSNDSSNHSH